MIHAPLSTARTARTARTGRTALLATALTASLAAAALLGAPAASATPSDPPGTLTTTNLAPTLVSPFAAYRIPALSYLGDNVVVAAWDGRPGSAADSPNPNSIVQRRSTDGGATWSTQATVLQGNPDTAGSGANKYGYSDPSYVYDHVAGTLFLFSVYSKDQGFGGSTFGNDDANRQVISAQVSQSTDLGLTWGAPRLITSVVKPGTSSAAPVAGDVRGMFATSGSGIQLNYGSHAGRLIQQFAGDVRQADGTNQVEAYSVYSDDHGASWSRGAFVGTGMDENKTVELSDGRVLLNSRDHANQGYRKVALSSDGGATYGPVTSDLELPDPANNASLVRLYPDAAAGTPEAKILLFTNANSQSARQNLTARVSCDDGATWPFARQLNAGFSAYSVAARLGGDSVGVLYESSYSTGIQFAALNDAWLAYSCGGVTPIAGTTVTGQRTDAARNLGTAPYSAGEQVPYSFRVTNHSTGTVSTTPTAGNFTPLVAPGTGNCRYLALAAGASYTCATPTHTVTAAEASQGYFVPDTTWSVSPSSSGSGRVLGLPVNLTAGVHVDSATISGVSIVGARADAGRDVAASPYAAGDTIAYRFAATNTTATTVSVAPSSGNFTPLVAPGTGNCRYSSLAAGASYTCTTPTHTVTAAEASQGYFVPDTTWGVTVGTTTTSARILGTPVSLR
ncbi:sialidase family protein [Subtercola sp. RTI3]|uniref:sialidase family protein n=1 Tax=Subtercola sp. RTI3 TaxID=3048639 RepID=UPI002B232F12|nr:sialidase family protein [Subtercola sp. RTI3]MEA9984364.1 sialidase family protein [Subtercola sp. RTI3]